MSDSITMTVRDLRRRWKPIKERLGDDPRYEGTLIRVHRACSWMQRVEDIAGDGDSDDAAIVFLWIAFNALYGRWDEKEKEPERDVVNWQSFLGRVCKLDGSGHIAGMLTEHRALVKSLLEDEYLSRWFWQDPSEERARKQRKAWFEARSWYAEGRHAMILDRVVERVYLQRCQLVHGAATHGGQLNREPSRHPVDLDTNGTRDRHARTGLFPSLANLVSRGHTCTVSRLHKSSETTTIVSEVGRAEVGGKTADAQGPASMSQEVLV